MPSKAGPLVVDTTTLSNFARISRPDLLRTALGSQGVLTEMVRAELRSGEASGLIPIHDWDWLPELELSPSEVRLFAALAEIVDYGEASCLAIAISQGAIVVTDDFQARRLARKEGVQVTGPLGVLTPKSWTQEA